MNFKKFSWICIVICFLLTTGLFFYKSSVTNIRRFIVITDLEPDDRIALHILAAKIPHDEILFVGTNIKNAARKKALTRKLMDQLGLIDIPVYQGTGGAPESYYDIASSRAAREYAQEGEDLLPLDQLQQLNHMSYSSLDLQNQIEGALDHWSNIEFILLAPPTDIIGVLNKKPALKKHIKHIYVMGGWSEVKEGNKTILRTTYNWNMDPIASAQLMSMNDIPMTLYSSDLIKHFFNGGSCNMINCKDVMMKMEALESSLPSLHDQKVAALSWDNHIIQKIPALQLTVEPYKGKQFTPADPLIIVGIVNKKLITKSELVDITIDVQDLDKSKGFRVDVAPDSKSKIMLVTAIDTQIFKDELIDSLNILASKPAV